MKRLLLLTVLSLFSCSVFGQNAYQILNTGRTVRRLHASVVERTMLAPAAQTSLARYTASLTSPRYLKVARLNNKITGKQVSIHTEFLVPRLANPTTIYGGYNYLRTIAKIARQPNCVEPAYARMWAQISDNNTYHGAHHIVNKSTLAIIYEDMLQKAESANKPLTVDLGEMQNNAPGIFHILHGHPAYQRVFHNSTRQTEIYYKYGMRAVITDFFDTLNRISAESNGTVPAISSSTMAGTYTEAELWCKTFHLRWE